MDTQKLLRILVDLQEEESGLAIAGKIDAVRNSIAQNNPEGFATAQTQVAELIELIKGGLVYQYSRSEAKLLEDIGGDAYFGAGLVQQLEVIFSGRSFEYIAKIDEYRGARNDFIKRAQRFATACADMGIEEYRPDSAEIGLLLPEEEGDFDKVARRLNTLRNLLWALGEASGTEAKEIKITRLSNGSLELFSLQPIEVAELLSTLLINITLIWDKIAKLRKKTEETENDPDLSPVAKKSITKALKEETERMKEEVFEELTEKIIKQVGKKLEKVAEERRPEVRNQIHLGIKAIFAWFQLGIELDITPVRMEGDEEPSEKEVKQGAIVQEAATKLQEIYKLPVEMRKLPFELPAPNPEQPAEDEDKPEE